MMDCHVPLNTDLLVVHKCAVENGYTKKSVKKKQCWSAHEPFPQTNMTSGA